MRLPFRLAISSASPRAAAPDHLPHALHGPKVLLSTLAKRLGSVGTGSGTPRDDGPKTPMPTASRIWLTVASNSGTLNRSRIAAPAASPSTGTPPGNNF